LGRGGTSSRHGGSVGREAGRAVSAALGAAEAVLAVQALSVVRAAGSAVVVLVQRRTVEIGLAALVHSLDAGSGGRRSSSGTAQGQSAVSEVALLLGLAVGERVGVPQAVGIGEAANAVGVVIAAAIAATSQACSLAAAVSGRALSVDHTASALVGDVGAAGSGAGGDSVVAELARPSATRRGNTVLAVVEGASGCGRDHGNHGLNGRNWGNLALSGGVRAASVGARNSGVVARSTRPHASVSSSAGTTGGVAARVGERARGHWNRHGGHDHRARVGASIRDRVTVEGASPGRTTHTGNGGSRCLAAKAASLAFGAAVAVLVRSALAVVGAANSAFVVHVQRSAVEVLAVALIQSLDASSGGRSHAVGGADDQLPLLVSKIALLLGFAVALHSVGVPQAVGTAETAAAVLVIVARFVAFESNALAILASTSGTTALAVASATTALGRGERTRAVQGARHTRATTAGPIAARLVGTRLAVVVGACTGCWDCHGVRSSHKHWGGGGRGGGRNRKETSRERRGFCRISGFPSFASLSSLSSLAGFASLASLAGGSRGYRFVACMHKHAEGKQAEKRKSHLTKRTIKLSSFLFWF